MAKKQAVVPPKATATVENPPAPPKSELQAAKKWLEREHNPTVVVVSRVSHDRCTVKAVVFGTGAAALNGIVLSSRVAGQLPGQIAGGRHELCASTARAGSANDPAVSGDLSHATPDRVWTSQYLSDCPLLFVTTDVDVKYDNVVFLADKKELAELLAGLRIKVSEPSRAQAEEVKTKVAPPSPTKKPAAKPAPAPDAEPELEEVDAVPEDEADEMDAEAEESDTYTAEELKALSDKELLTILTDAGIEVGKGAKRPTLLALALSQTEELEE